MSGKSVLPTCCQSSQVSVELFPTGYGFILEMRGISLRTLCSRLTFLVGLGKNTFDPNATVVKVFFFELNFLTLSSLYH